jgi:hypothetical protein
VNGASGLHDARWYTRVARSNRPARRAAVGTSPVLADDEYADRVDLHARHDPEVAPVADEVPDLRYVAQVANVRGRTEAESHPLLKMIHRLGECPDDWVLNGTQSLSSGSDRQRRRERLLPTYRARRIRSFQSLFISVVSGRLSRGHRRNNGASCSSRVAVSLASLLASSESRSSGSRVIVRSVRSRQLEGRSGYGSRALSPPLNASHSHGPSHWGHVEAIARTGHLARSGG